MPDNVRRYYIPSTPHGGGAGGFNVTPAAAPACPGPNFGRGMFAANPVPHTETFNAIRLHFRNWVMKDTPPPPSKYPTLANGFLVDPTKEAIGFPSIPGRAGNGADRSDQSRCSITTGAPASTTSTDPAC